MDADRKNEAKVNPAALTVAEVAPILGVAVEVVEKDVQEGTAVAADGNGRACAALGCSAGLPAVVPLRFLESTGRRDAPAPRVRCCYWGPR
jgi:hypothetical protein